MTDTWNEWEQNPALTENDRTIPRVERFKVREAASIMPEPTEWNLSVAQAAALVGLGRQTMYKLAREGRVESRRVLGHWRFSEARLRAWVESGEAASA